MRYHRPDIIMEARFWDVSLVGLFRIASEAHAWNGLQFHGSASAVRNSHKTISK